MRLEEDKTKGRFCYRCGTSDKEKGVFCAVYGEYWKRHWYPKKKTKVKPNQSLK